MMSHGHLNTTTHGRPARWSAGLLALVATVTLACNCGLSDSTIELFAPGGGTGSPQCSAAGETCPFGCSEGLGCVECIVDDNCPTDQSFCVLGECHDCRTTTDCPAGRACFPDGHECEELCNGPSDCEGDQPFCDLASEACIGCRNDGDCGGELPVCEPTQAQCGECASDSSCPPERPTCDLEDAKCRECLVDAHCEPGALCDSDRECHQR
jgi:hypothetical protein